VAQYGPINEGEGGFDMNRTNPFPWSWLWKILGVGAVLWLLVYTWQLWLLMLSALILAAAMLPVARLGERWRIPRTFIVIVVYLGLALIFSILGRFIVPMLVEQGSEFADKLPAIVANVKGWLSTLTEHGWAIPLPGPENWKEISPTVIENTLLATAGVVGGMVGFLLILFLAAYIVVDGERISRGLLALVPPEARQNVSLLAGRVLQRMGGYVRGQIVVSGCVGIILVLGLWLLGIPYALLIGSLAAVLNVVPFLGATISSVLAILTALNLSLPLALWTALLFWGVNLIEGKFLVPQLIGRATELHPLAVMLVILLGAKLGGIVGAVVAVPLVAGAWEIVRVLWVEPNEIIQKRIAETPELELRRQAQSSKGNRNC
jgi:predicted PurR-regulated permease PerM